MKAYGYAKGDVESDSPAELREVALRVKVDEIQSLIEFLAHAKARLGSSPASNAHLHLRDWWKAWTDSDTDLIVAVD